MFALAALAFGACGGNQDYEVKEFDILPNETDSVFVTYLDSLKAYFSPLEIELLRQFKRNAEALETEKDFYEFYRKATTLRGTLSKHLNNYANKQRKAGKETFHEMPWISLLATGLDVRLIFDGMAYDVYIDYGALAKYAAKTEGSSDDAYISLMQAAYVPFAHQVAWENKAGKCSRLGAGTHLEVIKTARECIDKDAFFTKDAARIRDAAMSDILNSKLFCLDQKKARAELKKIMALTLPDDAVTEKLAAKLELLSQPEPQGLSFGCESGGCGATASR